MKSLRKRKDGGSFIIKDFYRRLIETGQLYYAKSLKMPKTGIHIMIDDDNLEWLKKAGKGYQPRLNNVFRWARLNNCPIDKM